MKKILVVEDEEKVRKNLCDLLVNENYSVESASDGINGLEKVKLFTPDLIVCDVTMPSMNGFELLLELQKNEQTKNIPFIFLTAKVELEYTRYGMKIGADDYVLKPFNIEDLLDTIDTRLKKKEINEKPLMEMQEQITSKIPHELRTPLVPILGYAELIEELDDIDEIKKFVQIIKSSGITLKEKIEKFLFYKDLTIVSFNQQKRNEIRNAEFKINSDVVESILLPLLKKYDAQVRTRFYVESSFLKMKENHFERIIYELVDNSLKYSDRNSLVTIYGNEDNGKYKLSIKDNGRGIKENEIKSISTFKKFGDNQLSEPGLGLGLPIVNKICEIFNCDIEIRSNKTNGTLIEIRFELTRTNHNDYVINENDFFMGQYSKQQKMKGGTGVNSI